MNTKTTASLKPAEVEKKWIVIDAENAVVGRLATFIAMRLRGKHRARLHPERRLRRLRRRDQRRQGEVHRPQAASRRSTTGTPATRAASRNAPPARSSTASFPERVLEKAVERMLPKESPLARKQLTHLRIYNGAEHPHEAQNPETIAFADLNAKNVRSA